MSYLEIGLAGIGGAAGGYFGYDVSYWAGRIGGHDILQMWPMRNHLDKIKIAQEHLRERENKLSWVILAGHFMQFLRGTVSLLAGMIPMHYAKFAAANLLGAIGWSLGNVVAFLAGATWVASWFAH
jgi:membrane protein DedA with SNARE-associated domain